MSQWKRKGFKEHVALYYREAVAALKHDRESSLMKFAVIFWNVRILRICLHPASVICSVKTELGQNTFFLACVHVY